MVLSSAYLLKAENTCYTEGRRLGRLEIVLNNELGLWTVNRG